MTVVDMASLWADEVSLRADLDALDAWPPQLRGSQATAAVDR
jgi:hypothetical protein